MKAGIDWEASDKAFESQYWSPTEGKGTELVLANWRLEERKKFVEDGKPDLGEVETVLAFDVIRAGEQEYTPGSKVWRSASRRLYDAIKPILQEAEKVERGQVVVHVELTKTKEYVVIDLLKARGSA